MQKKGFNFRRTRRADVTHVDVTRHARSHGRAVQAYAAPRWCRGGADMWQGPHEFTVMPGWRHVAVRGQAGEGPTG